MRKVKRIRDTASFALLRDPPLLPAHVRDVITNSDFCGPKTCNKTYKHKLVSVRRTHGAPQKRVPEEGRWVAVCAVSSQIWIFVIPKYAATHAKNSKLMIVRRTRGAPPDSEEGP